MTTAQQRRFYFPAWTAAARNHGWHTATPAHVDFFGTPMLNPIYQRICQIAAERIAAAGCAGKPSSCAEHYRHACHIVTFGQDKSSSALTNAELDRIVALFKLLEDPDDLAATLRWNNPQEEARKRMLWWLRKNCVESYIVEVCRQKCGTDNWEALDYEDLRKLHMTLKNRPAALKSSARAPRALPPQQLYVNLNREMPVPEATEPQPF